MKLARAGALAIFAVAAGVGTIGLYLTWGLVTNALHPTSVGNESTPARTVLTQPMPPGPPLPVVTPVVTADAPATPPADQPPAPNPVPPAPKRVQLGQDETPGDAPIEIEVADPKVVPEGSPSSATNKRGLVVLHIGDSHTSADFLTGEVRRRLQARYGRGGTGYMTAGHPHAGVRSSQLKITASAGWTYKSLQRPDAQVPQFWLSGYDSIATQPGETMSFASDKPLTFDMIEVEAVGQPGGGAIDIKLDGNVETHYELASTRIEPIIIRLLPGRGPTEKVREVTITTTGAGTVTVGSVSIYNNRSGVTYNSVGYVGAQIGLLKKMNEKLFASDLARIDPQIVVLSFGTNEASNEHLDPAQYGKTYEAVVQRIKATLPRAAIVVVSPPDFNEIGPACPKEKVAEASCHRAPPELASTTGSASPTPPAPAAPCTWHTPAKLQQVRDAQRDIAKRYGLVYWNWGSIMPGECAAHQWVSMNPPLMSRDHVHFTADGYRKSAEQFLNVLIPCYREGPGGGQCCFQQLNSRSSLRWSFRSPGCSTITTPPRNGSWFSPATSSMRSGAPTIR